MEQFTPEHARQFRLEVTAAVLVEPATRVSVPALQPHRAALALRAEGDPAWQIGHDVFGPVFDSFARWLAAELDEIATATGKPVKPLFLLRDGYLPQRCAAAIGCHGAAVSVSRFTARRASFADVAAIEEYLDEEATDRVPVLAAQLGLSAKEAETLGPDAARFRRNVLRADTAKRIIARSHAFAKRLIAHLGREGRLQAGDAVVLVDTGYRGTVQQLIAPLLTRALGVTVHGRYLLSTGPASAERCGLLDGRHYPARTLKALCTHVALLEQAATSGTGSVIDYAENGRAILKPNGVPPHQRDTRATLQQGVIDFINTASRAAHRPAASDDAAARRRMAAAALARLLFLPQAHELAVINQFRHDINLGTSDIVRLADADQAGAGLRRRGLPYVRATNRMFLPGELQPHGLPLNLSLFAASCFELDLRVEDFKTGAMPVPLILADARQVLASAEPAHRTHDGFYTVTVPIGSGRFGVGLKIGEVCAAVQIDEIAFLPVSDLAVPGMGTALPEAPRPTFDAMQALGDGIWRCDANSLLFVPPPAEPVAESMVLSVTFRPLAGPASMALAAAA